MSVRDSIELGEFYVVGARQRLDRTHPEWTQYDQGLILRVDSGSGSVKTMVEYRSPPAVRPDEEAEIQLKCGIHAGDRLYLCTSTEVLVYAVPSFAPLGHLSHPYFNDLHHVTLTPAGDLVVVDTGLDMVLVMSLEGKILREYSVNDEPLWTRFSRSIDYRKVVSTKPHHSHPNFAFTIDGALWVTRCEDKDAVCLEDRRRRFDIAVQYPHDGTVHGGRVYFTTIDGRVCLFDTTTLARVAIVDLNTITARQRPLGWCRGLFVLDQNVVVVGFTRLRYTKFKEKVEWLKWHGGVGGSLTAEPTRIAAYDLAKGTMLWEAPMEQYGLNTIWGIYRA